MKFYLFAVLTLLLTTSSLQAQNTDFAPVGAKWIYSELDFALRSVPHVIESIAKENYQGKWCSKLVLNPPSVGVLPTPTYVYTQNDTVFFYSTLTNRFEMLYDFTAEVGDQWVVGGVYSVDDEGNILLADTITVDSIGFIPINSTFLKVWYISNGKFYDWGRKIYDQIGNEGMFAPKYAMWELQVGDLRCFETSDTAFQFVSFPCDTIFWTINAIKDFESPLEITFGPNPFLEQVRLQCPNSTNTLSFDLFNNQGQQVISRKFFKNLELETTSLPPGIYHWSVQQNGKAMCYGSCIKIE